MKWKAFANGKGKSNMETFLTKHYDSEITVEKALVVGVATLCASLDSASPEPNTRNLRQS